MNKAIQFLTSDFPRAPALLFCAWVLCLVMSDLLAAFGFVLEPPTMEEREKQNTVVHFVKFQTIELDNFTIMIGTQYQANDGSAPEKQWCYVSKFSSEGSHSINITLAKKEGIHPTVYQNISQLALKKLELRANELQKLAKTHCNFI